VIELDGSQHLDQYGHDRRRSHFLESQGCRVIRSGMMRRWQEWMPCWRR
jgi:very-short-patch-repair endonuclease